MAARWVSGTFVFPDTPRLCRGELHCLKSSLSECQKHSDGRDEHYGERDPEECLRKPSAPVFAHDLFVRRNRDNDGDERNRNDAIQDGGHDERFDRIDADEVDGKTDQVLSQLRRQASNPSGPPVDKVADQRD